MFVARMDSEHYEWMAFGATEDDARAALLNEWNARRRVIDYRPDPAGVDLSTWEGLVGWFGANAFPFELGQCFVDREPSETTAGTG